MADIVCAGFGGQGVLTAGLILAKTGMDNGKYVTWIPSYGSEMRGGTANCNVKISDTEVASPLIREIDILIAMNEPSVTKFQSQVRTGGMMLVNTSIVKNAEYRRDIRVYELPATDLANDFANPRGANIAMIGAFAKVSGLLDGETMKQGVENFFLAKGKNNPQNARCFDAGYKQVTAVE